MISPSIFLSVGPTLLDKWGWFECPSGQASSDFYNSLPGPVMLLGIASVPCASMSASVGVYDTWYRSGMSLAGNSSHFYALPWAGEFAAPAEYLSLHMYTPSHSQPASFPFCQSSSSAWPTWPRPPTRPTTAWAGGRRDRALYLRARRDSAKHPNLSAAESERWGWGWRWPTCLSGAVPVPVRIRDH
jgi:hypothetical protein